VQGNLAALAPDQLSVILQYLPDPLLIIGEDRRILALNAAAQALTGLSAEVAGETCRDTIACHDRQGRALCDSCPHLTAATSRVALSQSGVAVRDGEGLQRPVVATYFPLRSNAGEPRVDALILAELAARPGGARASAIAGLHSSDRFQAIYTREQERAQRFQSGLALVRVGVRARPAATDGSATARSASPAELDAAFEAVAALLLRNLRAVDALGHCDTHECAILLPAATFAGTRALVTRLESRLRELTATGALPPTVEVCLGVVLSEGYENLLARGGQRLAPLPTGE
jgi:PAS fold